MKKFDLHQKTGFSIQSQSLKSSLLYGQDNDVIDDIRDSLSNNLNWLRKKFYTTLSVDFSGTRIKITVALPISLQQTVYNDEQYKLSRSLSRVYFSPSMQLKCQTGLENYVALNYNLSNIIGDINDVYNGYILKNYRTFFSNNAGLVEQENHNLSLGFFYRKGIKLSFFNINIFYNQNIANSITSSIATSNLQQRITIPFQNITNSWGVSGIINKYLFFLNTNASFSPNFQMNNVNILQNGVLYPYKTQSVGYNASFEVKVSDQISGNYRNYFTRFNSYADAVRNSKFSQVRQHASINYTPLSRLLFKISTDYYIVNQSIAPKVKSFFVDLSTRFMFPKRKITTELSALNFFNATEYRTAYLSGNLFSSSSYLLPGRMIMGKISFNY